MASKRKRNAEFYRLRIEAAERYRDNTYRDRWERYFKQYQNVVDQLKDQDGKPIKDRSNISIPYSFTQLETILPRLVETLFAGRPYVTVKGVPFSVRDWRDNQLTKPWEQAAKKMETLLDYQQNIVFDIQDEFHIGLKICGLYGTTVAHTCWRLSEKTVRRKELVPVMSGEIDPETGKEMPIMDREQPLMDWQPVDVTVKEYDDPQVNFIDLGLFFVDPNGEDIDDARYCGHVAYLTREQIDQMAASDPDGFKVNWNKVPKIGARNEARQRRLSMIGLPGVDSAGFEQNEEDTLYEVHFYWEDDRKVVLINREYLAQDVPNPYWHKKKPYDKEVYTKVPGEFYGIGVMQILEDLQAELNTERNQRIDYRSMSMRRMFKVRKGAQIRSRDLVWKQNGVIQLDKMDDLEVLEAPDSALGGSFNEEQIIKQDMRDATGAQDVVMGAQSGGTATEAMRNDNNAAMRFKMLISSIEKRLLVAVSMKMIWLNQQYLEDVRVLPLDDMEPEQWPEIAPEDIQGEMRLTASGSSVEPAANKEAFKQRLVELYGIVAADPFMQQFPDKRRNFLKKIFEAFDLKDTDDLLPTDDELAPQVDNATIQRFLQQLPPDLQQLVMMVMQPPAAPGSNLSGPPQGGALPQGAMPTGGGLNTAAMQEQGLGMAGRGGVPLG